MSKSLQSLKVALVHDDLVQFGGAERVLLGLCQIFPNASIYTSAFDKENKILFKHFNSKGIITTFIQKIPYWKKLYKAMLPLYPIAFEQFDFSKYDLVISHTTRFAKSIITKPETYHISYCHTPPRFLWHFSDGKRFGIAESLMSKLRVYDAITSARVDNFIAGSKNAQQRIKKVYNRDSKFVYPFVDLERFKGIERFNGGYYLVISRMNKYKNVELAVKACLKLKAPLKLIGQGPEYEKLKALAMSSKGSVEFLGNISDQDTAIVISGCKALIIPGIEDFGLTSLEAQALGKPVIAYGYGGARETVIEDKTGVFFQDPTDESLIEALKKLESKNINPQTCINNANLYSMENFATNFKQTVASLLYTR